MGNTKSNITIFILVWLAINLFTAGFTELGADEAYYWLYGHQLDWGYFDHPPLIAVINSIIDRNIWHSELSVRFISVLSTAGYLYFLYKLIKPKESLYFILISSSVFALHLFSFTSLPDTPLLFLSIAFYYYFVEYIKKESTLSIVALCIIVPLLFYTKYHAVIILALSLLAFPKTFKQKSFYLIFIVSVLLYTPHIYWQISHDFPSIKYHFLERNASNFSWNFVWDYLGGQILFYGPFLILTSIIYLVKHYKKQNVEERLMKFTLIGFFLFFLWSSKKAFVEVNWTLPAMTAVIYLAYRLIETNTNWAKKVIKYSSIFNLTILVLLRAHLLFPFAQLDSRDRTNDLKNHKQLVQQVVNKIGDTPIITNRYQHAALLSYYTNSFIESNNTNGRKNQFNIWNNFNNVNNKKYFFLSDDTDSLNLYSPDGQKYALSLHENIPCYSGVRLDQVSLTENDINLIFEDSWFKELQTYKNVDSTKLHISIYRDNQDVLRKKLTIEELQKLQTPNYTWSFKKRIEKETCEIEISLNSVNFGSWSERWRKKIEIE